MITALMVGYFVLILAATAAAGYFLLDARESKAESQSVLLTSQGTEVLPAEGHPSLSQLLRKVGQRAPASNRALLRRTLASAGYRHPEALLVFQGIKMSVGFVLAFMLGAVAFFNTQDVAAAVIAAAAGAGFGMMLPERVLRGMVKARVERIRQAIPVCLDLIVLSVEAGQSMNQAILDASVELHEAYPDMSNELAQVHLELRAGKGRMDALYDLGERNSEPELRKLANVLIDSDRFGTSLAPALKTHAKYLRIRMRQKAQESARKVSVKLVFPVFFLIFPSVLLVTLGPAVLKLMEQFRKLVGQ